MGFQKFLDALLGRSRLPKPRTEKLFAISTASITLESSLGLKPAGVAGLCFKPIEASAYSAAEKEIEELISYGAKETGTEYRLKKDEYNFLWAIFKDQDFDDLVGNIHLVSDTLTEKGFGERLLCAIYRFEGEKPVYWIYNFKQGNYYPFVPLSGKQRDSAFEFRLRTGMELELPIEKNVEKWYPLWGIPF